MSLLEKPFSPVSNARRRRRDMGRKSSITGLDPEIKAEVDRLIASGRFTIDQVVTKLRELGAEVSRSAVGRYTKDFEEVARHMREARQVAASFAQSLGDIPDNDMGRALVEMLHHMIFKMMLSASGENAMVAPEDLMRLAKALKDAAATNKLSVDLELKIREEVEKKTKDAAAKVADKIGREKGLSADTIGAIKAQILGVQVK
jgi:hypothetical protein